MKRSETSEKDPSWVLVAGYTQNSCSRPLHPKNETSAARVQWEYESRAKLEVWNRDSRTNLKGGGRKKIILI